MWEEEKEEKLGWGEEEVVEESAECEYFTPFVRGVNSRRCVSISDDEVKESKGGNGVGRGRRTLSF